MTPKFIIDKENKYLIHTEDPSFIVEIEILYGNIGFTEIKWLGNSHKLYTKNQLIEIKKEAVTFLKTHRELILQKSLDLLNDKFK